MHIRIQTYIVQSSSNIELIEMKTYIVGYIIVKKYNFNISSNFKVSLLRQKDFIKV